MRPHQVQQVLALESHLDRHDELLKHSKAVYASYAKDQIEDLPFQTTLVKQALSAKRRWTAELATGTGKSIVAARIAKDRIHDGPVIYVSPSAASIGDRQNGVINKFARTLGETRVELGAINELSRANDVCFVTPRVLSSALEREPTRVTELLRRASCFIVDEAHHFPDDPDRDLRIYGRLHEAAECYVRDGLTVAMTGTWSRLDGKAIMGARVPDARLTVQDAVDLGRCPELYGIQVITDVVAKKATSRGDLYDFHLSGTERRRYVQGVVDCMETVYRRYPVPFAAFARSIKDAEAIAAGFNKALQLGPHNGLIVLSSMTPIAVRLQAINDITANRRVGYITCAIGEEAIDIPSLEVIHMIRRTRSYVRNGQAIGRSLRVFNGKRRALIVDYQTMLEGICDRFVGLSLDDLPFGATTGHRVNGGPLVAQRSYDQGVLVGMTLGEERALCIQTKHPSVERKLALLELARSGAKRPRSANRQNRGSVSVDESTLAHNLYNYTHETAVYDAVFTRALRELRPDWLTPRVASTAHKATLIELARSGAGKPARDPRRKTACHKLAIALFNYTSGKTPAYDAVFTVELRRLRPDWFERRRGTANSRKQELVALAQQQAPRPYWKSTLGKALVRYVGKASPLRDAKLAAQLQQLCPSWFLA